ncbi:MAG TPA: DUF6220 domain-containing protein [Ktedonobacterales bacterium]
MFTHAMRWAYVVYAWIILAAVVVQFFLAGRGVFAGVSNFQTHANFGNTIFFVMLLGLVLAFAARLPWRAIGLTALLPVLVGLQSVFIEFWHSGQGGLAAFHVINGLAIFSLTGFLALRSRGYIAVQQRRTALREVHAASPKQEEAVH